MPYLQMPTEMTYDNTQEIPEIIEVSITADQKSGIEINSRNKGRKFKIKEIMLGVGPKRKSIDYDKNMMPHAECRAEILPNGKLRII